MRRKLAIVLLALSVFTATANAAPRNDDERSGLIGRLRHVVQQLVKHITGDELSHRNKGRFRIEISGCAAWRAR